MEKFNQENIKNEKSFEQLESFDLGALEAQADNLSSEQKAEIEQAHEQKEVESRQELLDMFNRFEGSDRETSAFDHFQAQANNEKDVSSVVYLGDYDANFAADYGSREDFELRANTGKSQAYLQEENSIRKGQIHTVSAQAKRKNLTRAFMQTMGFGRVT